MSRYVYLDFETTGVNPKEDRIVSYGFVDTDGNVLEGKLNPGIPIPESSSLIHGIRDEDVKGCPYFQSVASDILDFLGDSPLVGFNHIAFDVPLLYAEFCRIGVSWTWKKHQLIDLGNIFKIMNPRTLSAAVLRYLGHEHDGAHGAINDASVLMDIHTQMLKVHDELRGLDDQALSLFSNYGKRMADLSGRFYVGDDGEYYLNFGIHKDKKAKDCADYLSWMLRANFPPDTCEIASEILGIHHYATNVDDLPF